MTVDMFIDISAIISIAGLIACIILNAKNAEDDDDEEKRL